MTPASAPSRGRSLTSLSERDPAAYERHLLHATSRSYLETNCYADVIIELLHACGYEPLAAFAHLVRLDFEGDQWTFFKPPAEDLERLFGIDIHEMQPYRQLPVQISEQLRLGRTMIVELDSWFLPDTASTSYRTEHVKTSVAADAIDLQAETLRYFHGPGLFELSGDDYRGIFRLDGQSPDVLPPYAELVRFDAGPRLESEELRSMSRVLLRAHLSRRPAANPFHGFGEQLSKALPDLLTQGLDAYHAYAFATARMAGSAFEALATYIDWLSAGTEAEAVAAMRRIVDGCKALSFRLARRRTFDVEPLISPMADAWAQAMIDLDRFAG
jgi:Domain of unknown function (DUF1839)